MYDFNDGMGHSDIGFLELQFGRSRQAYSLVLYAEFQDIYGLMWESNGEKHESFKKYENHRMNDIFGLV